MTVKQTLAFLRGTPFYLYIEMKDERKNWTEQDWIAFGEQLDNFYAWPALYTFKFVVKSGQEEDLKKLFPKHEQTAKPSKNGNYTAVTFEAMMPNALAVVDVYKKASVIEGIIAL